MIDLSMEIEEFDDFIIGDYIDSFKNLTLKTFSGYKYYRQYCGGAQASWQQQQIGDKSQAADLDNGVQWVLMGATGFCPQYYNQMLWLFTWPAE